MFPTDKYRAEVMEHMSLYSIKNPMQASKSRKTSDMRIALDVFVTASAVCGDEQVSKWIIALDVCDRKFLNSGYIANMTRVICRMIVRCESDKPFANYMAMVVGDRLVNDSHWAEIFAKSLKEMLVER